MSSASRGKCSRIRLTRFGISSVEKKKLPADREGLVTPFRPGCSPSPNRVTSTRLETSWRTRVSSSSQLMLHKRDQSLRPVRATTRVYPQVPGILQSEWKKLLRTKNLGHLRSSGRTGILEARLHKVR